MKRLLLALVAGSLFVAVQAKECCKPGEDCDACERSAQVMTQAPLTAEEIAAAKELSEGFEGLFDERKAGLEPMYRELDEFIKTLVVKYKVSLEELQDALQKFVDANRGLFDVTVKRFGVQLADGTVILPIQLPAAQLPALVVK